MGRLRIYRKQMERIVVTCSMLDKDKAIDYVYNNGYKSKVSGPKYKGKGRYDLTRFQIVAEREIQS